MQFYVVIVFHLVKQSAKSLGFLLLFLIFYAYNVSYDIPDVQVLSISFYKPCFRVAGQFSGEKNAPKDPKITQNCGIVSRTNYIYHNCNSGDAVAYFAAAGITRVAVIRTTDVTRHPARWPNG